MPLLHHESRALHRPTSTDLHRQRLQPPTQHSSRSSLDFAPLPPRSCTRLALCPPPPDDIRRRASNNPLLYQARPGRPRAPKMEPRARAGKNVGKMNFSHNELAQLLFAHGDVKNPLPETVRVLDEILTDFMQSIAFEATRAAHYSGRQKIKYEDFEFAFRKNPAFLGKVQEVFEKQREIKKAREILRDGEDEIIKDAADEEKRKGKADPRPPRARAEEELGEADDDADAEADALGRKR
ncbi:hypothetical protein G6O67_001457 [Ophiocordyceps sinensis]|uniref:Transcription initiation factor TFIID subunit 13 n=2 Tax=Ophiocordyceps sinensis TaxID=72228 RepID=A0A8H4PXP3_9HYPO|nr:hypothetical protein G6O67_001457 [Ophiocordyceps sinensis]